MIIGIQLGLDFNVYFVCAVLCICLIKYVLTEGIARYQLVTGSSLIEGWGGHFHKVVQYTFFVFFLIWSLLVAAALTSACGIAGSALFPFESVAFWGATHAIVACVLVLLGKYSLIENLSRILIFLMVLIVVVTACFLVVSGQIDFSHENQVAYDRPTLYFAVAGAIGGSVTMLSYGYWIKEKGWTQVDDLPRARADLQLSYAITAVFILALMVTASAAEINDASGMEMILALARVLQETMGPIGFWLFKLAFWGVVFSSMVSVWSGVPYLFCDFLKGAFPASTVQANDRDVVYRIYLLYIALVPILLMFYVNAVQNVVNYALISAVFVFGLSASLLILNRKKVIGTWGNSPTTNVLLQLSLLVFAGLVIYRLWW